MAYTDEDEAVVIRRLAGADSVREIRINCPDATGLGADIMRVLFDFGLRIIDADISTDGEWCFLVIKVALPLSNGLPSRWALLKSRLEEICPTGSDALRTLIGRRDGPVQQHPFAVKVYSNDQQGMLHALAHALWDADTSVFKSHVVTTPSGEAQDEFYVVDNRGELPADHRILEICDRVKGMLGPDTYCCVDPLPLEALVCVGKSEGGSIWDDEEDAVPIGRRLCKHSTSQSNLHAIVQHRKRNNSGHGSSNSLDSPPRIKEENEEVFVSDGEEERNFGFKQQRQQRNYESSPTSHGGGDVATAAAAQLRRLQPPPSPLSAAAAAVDVSVEIDNATSPSYTQISLQCQDRKGLVYDLFVDLKELDLRVAYARVHVDAETEMASLELFVQDSDGHQVTDEIELMELVTRLRCAAALPVRIEVEDVQGGLATQLTVAAAVDSGGRGRPRVTFDVTQGLSSANLDVQCADVYVEPGHVNVSQPPSPRSPARPQEVHRFLVRCPEGGSLDKEEDREVLREVVRSCLLGTNFSTKRRGVGCGHRQLSSSSPPALFKQINSHWQGVAGSS